MERKGPEKVKKIKQLYFPTKLSAPCVIYFIFMVFPVKF